MKKLFIIIISIFFSLFLCEIALRYVFINDQLKLRIEANKKQFKDFQKLTWNPNTLSFVPNSQGFVNHPEYNYTISHDSIGFRNPCNVNEKLTIKDIIIGDSFVYGVGVKDNDTLNCNIKVNNYTLGVPNASPICYLQIFKKHYPNIKSLFDINGITNVHVIFYLGNDFESLISLDGSCPSKSINNAEREKTNLLSTLNYTITRGFLSELYLPQLPKILYKSYINNKKYKSINSLTKKYFIDNGNDTFYTNKNQVNEEDLTNSLDILNKEFNKIDQDRLNIIFYLLPSGSDVSETRLIRKSKISSFDYELIDTNIKYSLILKSCKKLNIECKDLRKFFKDEDYYFHDTHLNAKGVKILSKTIENFSYVNN